jgi:N-acetylmuramoyl-L-alanine amidase
MTKLFSCILTTAVFCSSLVTPAGAENKMKITLGGESLDIATVDNAGLRYFSFSELASAMGGSLDWEIVGHKVLYEDSDHKMSFLIGSPYFTRDNDVHNMTYPAMLKAGGLYLPAATFLAFVGDISLENTSPVAEKTVRPKIRSNAFSVADLSISPKANGLLIEIYLTEPVNYDAFTSEGGWVNISVRDGKVNAALIESRIDKRFMYDLKCHQVGTTAQVSMWMRKPIVKWDHHLVNNPDRIQISFTDSAYMSDSSKSPVAVGPDKKIDVIVVDAGHGGSDYGAIGYNGAREKDVTLAIAREVATELRRVKSLKVIMTRSDDKTVSLQQRADIANNAGADLFISVHANANPKKTVRGWNVFFLAPAKNDSARAVEQLENSYFLRENSAFRAHMESDDANPVVGILNSMIMTEFQAESHDFAVMVDKELRRSMSHPSRGIDQAGFFVLNKVFTPSVLIETAFISNPTEEKLLRDRSFHRQIAESIAEAVKRFKAKYEDR